MIELRHVEKAYAEATPLTDVNVTINKGDVISIIGPSGTGKTTLIRCINMLDPPTKGEIIFEGENIAAPKYDLTKMRKKVGMVFQSFNLFGHLTVIENIMMPQIDLLGRTSQEAYDKGVELLKKVGLADKKLRYPDQLSGGQKQRVAIARTLAMDPEVVLLDEPTSALDPTMVGEVEAVIKDLAKSGITMMIVTHDMRLCREISTRVFYMDQGVVYEDGPPEQIFDNPQRERTQRFIRKSKILEIEVDSREFDFRGTIYTIEQFCEKYEIGKKSALNLVSVFEEFCKEILIDNLPDNLKINAVFDYDSVNKNVILTVKYNGSTFNPLESENELALAILKHHCSDITYSQINEDEFTNQAVLFINL